MKAKLIIQKVFNFRHWTRKSYAVFQSLKLQIRIATISIGLLLVSGFQEVIAQRNIKHENIEEYDLDTMEVLGELTPELAKELSRNIQVISVPSKSNFPFSSLQSTLNSIPNVDIRQRGPNDVQADVSINASTFDQVQVLLNGFDITDPQTGHHSFNVPVAFSQLKQIQILSGSGTRVLGVNAYGGAINLITKKPKRNAIELGASVGDFGYTNMEMSLGLYKNSRSNYFCVNRSSSNGYIKNTDFMKYSLFYNGEIINRSSSVEWQLAYMDKAFGANNFYTPKYPDQFEELRTAFAGLRYKTKAFVSTSSSVHYRANADRFELFRHGIAAPSWYSHHNYHFTQILQFNSKAWFWSKFGKTSASATYKIESIFSNVLGLEMTKQTSAIFDNGGFYNRNAQRSYLSLSMEQVVLLKNIKIAGGFMFYDFFAKEYQKGIFPGIDINYKIGKGLNLFAGINSGMRLPSFTDLYYSGPSNIGNPDLVAESQWTYQGGFRYAKSVFVFNANIFENRAENSIDWVRKNDSIKWQPINITNVKTFGFELAFSVYPTKKKLSGLDWLNEISVKWAYNNKQTASPAYQSHYVMDFLRNKFVFSLNHKIIHGLTLGYIISYQQRIGQYLLYDKLTNLSSPQDYQPYTLLDIKLNYKYLSWNFYANISNVFNIKYQDYGNVQQAGRWFMVGVNKEIGF